MTMRATNSDSRKERSNPQAGPIDNPFFIVGAERSGTTLLRLILGHHPEITPCNEFDYAVAELPWEDADHWPDADAYRAWVVNDRRYKLSGCEIDQSTDFPGQIRSFLGQARKRPEQTLFGAVVHRKFHHLVRIWPQAKYIHLVRDPRNVAASVMKMGWAGTAWHGPDEWFRVERCWDLLRAKISPSSFIEIRYEDFIAEPEQTVKEICGFLGVDYEPDMMQIDRGTTYSPPSKKVAGRWSESLTPYQVRCVETRVGAMLVDRGYEPSGYPPIVPSAPWRAVMSILDRINRFRVRMRKFGTFLSLKYMVSRKLPFKGWRRSVQREFDEAINATLK